MGTLPIGHTGYCSNTALYSGTKAAWVASPQLSTCLPATEFGITDAKGCMDLCKTQSSCVAISYSPNPPSGATGVNCNLYSTCTRGAGLGGSPWQTFWVDEIPAT